MLEASGEVVYVNEPMNPSHPPGRSPGVLDAPVEHYFHYVPGSDDARWRRAFGDTVRLRYRPVRELRTNHAPYDLARAAKYGLAFTAGRLRGRRALLDDPYALTSAGWLADHLGVSAVALVRDPVTLAGSWRRLGWHVDTAELLAQPALVRDHLGPYEDELAAHAGPADRVDRLAALAALWRATTGLLLDVASTRPAIHLQRYEALAAAPLDAFHALYDRLGLTWSEAARTTVDAATSGADASAERGFAWSLRGGLSRTAYRPMDSRTALAKARTGLEDDEVARVRDLTADVAERLAAILPPV